MAICILLSACMNQRTNGNGDVQNEYGQEEEVHVYEEIGLSKYDPAN